MSVGHPQSIEVAAAAESAGRIEREMFLDVVDRVADVRVRVVALRQEHRRAEKDRLPPPLASGCRSGS